MVTCLWYSVFGIGQARNRTARAVERAVPFQLARQAIVTCWYVTAGHDPADIQARRARAPGAQDQGPAFHR